MIEWIHPGVLLILGAGILPLVSGKARSAYLVALAAAALAATVLMTVGDFGGLRFLGLDLTFGRVDRLSLVFSYVFTIMALLGVIYSLHVKDAWQHAAALVYAGSALGVVFAGDFFVLFIFWELMAFSSVFLIWQNRTRESLAAGFRYLLIHVVGGASLLAGIILQYGATGTLAFNRLDPATAGFYLIMTGFILNAAVPPLSAWLTDAYPEATVTGAVFLSAFTTKTAVYVLVRGFPGAELLLWLGSIMAVYGVVYAVLQNDARRLLAYHIVSQVGYMVAGVGLGTDLSMNGSVAHAFAHIIYKGLLFMGAGSVLYVTGRRKLSDMGGLAGTMPLTLFLYMVGAFSISALPLTSGFVSKSMVTAGAAAAGRTLPFLLLTVASAGTFLSVGLKLPYFMFFGEDAGIKAKEPPANMIAAMAIAAGLCLFIGIFPGSLYALLPFPVAFHPYTAPHVVSTMQILLFTACGFLLLKAKLAPKSAVVLDTDWFYRKGAAAFMWLVRKPVSDFETGVVDRAHDAVTGRLAALAPVFLAADNGLIGRLVNGLGSGALAAGRGLASLQNGSYPRYALVMALGLAVMLFLALALYP